jgi:hypothetical protein
MNPDATASAARHIHDRDARHILIMILDAVPELRKHAREVVAATNAHPGTKPTPGGPKPDLVSLKHHAQALNTEFGRLSRGVSRAKTPNSKHGRAAKLKMVDSLAGFQRAMGELVASTYNPANNAYTLSHIKAAKRDLESARTVGIAALKTLQR